MNVISRWMHGWLDYIVSVLLILSPWILGFADDPMAMSIPVLLGASTIIYSLLTDYEMGMAKVISMRTHLSLDMASGIILILSPWVFAFAGYVWLPHVIAGVLELLVTFLTVHRNRGTRIPGKSLIAGGKA